MTPERQQQTIQALSEKGVKQPCPRCGTFKFSIAGETYIAIQEGPALFHIGGPTIPTVIVVCDTCGYITQHAQVTLGLLKGAKS